MSDPMRLDFSSRGEGGGSDSGQREVIEQRYRACACASSSRSAACPSPPPSPPLQGQSEEGGWGGKGRVGAGNGRKETEEKRTFIPSPFIRLEQRTKVGMPKGDAFV